MNLDLKSKWLKRKPDELIQFIINTYHNSHRQILPKLISRSEEMALVYSGNTAYPLELLASLKKLRQELFEHMEKEESILFPLLSAESHQYLCTQLHKAKHNHQDHRFLLEKIKQITDNFLPAKTDIKWKRFCADVTKFCDELEAHMMLEEEVLFNREYNYADSAQLFHG